MRRQLLSQFARLQGALVLLPDSRRIRITWAICSVVVVAGTAMTPRVHGASQLMGCESVCSTFCPTNVDEYCQTIGCASGGATCEDEVSCLLPYTFPKAIKCTSPH